MATKANKSPASQRVKVKITGDVAARIVAFLTANNTATRQQLLTLIGQHDGTGGTPFDDWRKKNLRSVAKGVYSLPETASVKHAVPTPPKPAVISETRKRRTVLREDAKVQIAQKLTDLLVLTTPQLRELDCIKAANDIGITDLPTNLAKVITPYFERSYATMLDTLVSPAPVPVETKEVRVEVNKLAESSPQDLIKALFEHHGLDLYQMLANFFARPLFGLVTAALQPPQVEPPPSSPSSPATPEPETSEAEPEQTSQVEAPQVSEVKKVVLKKVLIIGMRSKDESVFLQRASVKALTDAGHSLYFITSSVPAKNLNLPPVDFVLGTKFVSLPVTRALINRYGGPRLNMKLSIAQLDEALAAKLS